MDEDLSFFKLLAFSFSVFIKLSSVKVWVQKCDRRLGLSVSILSHKIDQSIDHLLFSFVLLAIIGIRIIDR